MELAAAKLTSVLNGLGWRRKPISKVVRVNRLWREAIRCYGYPALGEWMQSLE
jgi:hypothetical protein